MDRGFLGQVTLFKLLPLLEAKGLEGSALEKHFSQGETIFFEGDPVKDLFVVKEGRIKVVKYGSNGRCVTLHVLNSGDVFCTAAMLHHQNYPCNAIAGTDAVVVRINKQAYVRLIKILPPFAEALINKLSSETCCAHLLQAMAQEPVQKRVINILLSLAKSFGPSLPFTRQDIAFMAGTTVETSIRIISTLKKNGLLTSSRGKIYLKDLQKLQELL